MLDEVARRDVPLELLRREEVIVDAVAAPPAAAARVVADTDSSSSGIALEQTADQRALADAGGPGDHEDLAVAPTVARARLRGDAGTQRRRMSATSSRRWRSDRPPTVLLGEILHWPRILFTFTRPYLGTASSRSNTLAVAR